MMSSRLATDPSPIYAESLHHPGPARIFVASTTAWSRHIIDAPRAPAIQAPAIHQSPPEARP